MPGALTADRPAAPAHRSRFGPPERSEPDPADLSEFALSMQQAGMSWEDAALLDQWLVYQRPASAADVLAVLNTLKVDATMTRDEIKAMTEHIIDGLARSDRREPRGLEAAWQRPRTGIAPRRRGP
ncbi:hypothetical protein KZZ52_35160 [Dactylosporangium sp. AC04546]|uniref:hypothetical protein n=1 Tax=Dactylosporangium sp. AC04546 TaxID=2862460 RepID=UPI001EDCA6AB|nr:hypothetical protein [Dactylosporangium sp. AC04546]WVK79211.1 hypothetical protein KZZ52_35160 [Dactylosporangium sp. AC04546]